MKPFHIRIQVLLLIAIICVISPRGLGQETQSAIQDAKLNAAIREAFHAEAPLQKAAQTSRPSTDDYLALARSIVAAAAFATTEDSRLERLCLVTLNSMEHNQVPENDRKSVYAVFASSDNPQIHAFGADATENRRKVAIFAATENAQSEENKVDGAAQRSTANFSDYLRLAHVITAAADLMDVTDDHFVEMAARTIARLNIYDASVADRKELLEVLAQSKNIPLQKIARAGAEQLRLRTTPFAIKATAIDGRAIDSADWKGKVVLVDIWGTTCTGCISEMVRMKPVYEKYHDAGFEVVGIVLNDPKDAAKVAAIMKAKDIPWPQTMQGAFRESALTQKYGFSGLGTTWLLDKNGLLVSDSIQGESLERQVRSLLGLTPSDK